MPEKFINSSLLDLSSMTSIDELGAKKIINSGILIVPERLMPELTKLDIINSGSIIPVPEGVRVERQAGPMYASGEELASGGEDVILLITGPLYVTSPVEKVGYREISPMGPTYMPQGSEGAIRAKLGNVVGPSFSYRYPHGARLTISKEIIGRAFLEMLPDPTPLVVFGEVVFEKDVTPELLRSKIPEIVVIGVVSAPRDLMPVVQILATQKLGEIRVAAPDREVFATESLTRDYLELMSEPVRIVVYGMLTIEADVTPELFDEKVLRIDTYGMTKAPKALIPRIQMKGDTYGQVEAY